MGNIINAPSLITTLSFHFQNDPPRLAAPRTSARWKRALFSLESNKWILSRGLAEGEREKRKRGRYSIQTSRDTHRQERNTLMAMILIIYCLMRWGEVCMGLDGWWQPTSWRYAHLNVLHTHTHTPSALSSCCCNIYVPIYPLTHKCQRFSFSAQDPTSPLDALSSREPSQPACSGLLCVVFHVFIICSTCSFLPHSAARCSRLPLLQHPLLCRYCAPPPPYLFTVVIVSFFCSFSLCLGIL